jgi:hypothetical protein
MEATIFLHIFIFLQQNKDTLSVDQWVVSEE